MIAACKTIIDATQNSGMRSPTRKSPNRAEMHPTSQGMSAPPKPGNKKDESVSCDACLPNCRVKMAKVVGNTAAIPNPARPAPEETVIRLLPARMTTKPAPATKRLINTRAASLTRLKTAGAAALPISSPAQKNDGIIVPNPLADAPIRCA